MKAYEKSKKSIDKDPQYKQFIRCLADFEKFINDVKFFLKKLKNLFLKKILITAME